MSYIFTVTDSSNDLIEADHISLLLKHKTILLLKQIYSNNLTCFMYKTSDKAFSDDNWPGPGTQYSIGREFAHFRETSSTGSWVVSGLDEEGSWPSDPIKSRHARNDEEWSVLRQPWVTHGWCDVWYVNDIFVIDSNIQTNKPPAPGFSHFKSFWT